VNEEEGQGPLGGYRAKRKKIVTDVSNYYRLQVFSLPVSPNFLQGEDFNQCSLNFETLSQKTADILIQFSISLQSNDEQNEASTFAMPSAI
jgi:hypothetical protein